MSNCTCTTDKQMTCIVHPTSVSLKERIAELEAEAENAKTYMVKLSNAVTEAVAEVEVWMEAYRTLDAARKIDKDVLFKQDQTIQLRNATIRDLEAENKGHRLRIAELEGWDGD